MSLLIDNQEYLRRLEICKAEINESNCIGTVLFLLGLKNNDCHIEPKKAPLLFQNCFFFLEKTTIQALLAQELHKSSTIQAGHVLGLIGLRTHLKAQNSFPQLYHCLLASPIDSTYIVHRKGYHQNIEEIKIADLLTKYPPLLNVFIYTLKNG